ncbi:hypothetical protein CMT42_14915 [Elizabethkingia anophelis]|uniref:hypothetical protein n=2 Tax=Elizabethkingia TaxID=308865 RepID=UPI000999910A|nr:hypothetical protein [Elizabethkingia anophelis]MDV3894544.1 hypothetical protein [Elizabethkingia anophelis]MDV3914553.1 hypothetical protein [Elizabethkingia anophelis]MDV3920699.1 hypothetical protein [Elizabethkingia anophelis]MDV3959214.1 hypothetical protein [Elizabethkingia anophelis]
MKMIILMIKQPLDIKILRDEIGAMSFQCCLVNVDVIGIRIRKNYETVIIQYIAAKKVGFIYEAGKLSQEQVLRVYKDVPDNYNNLDDYEKEYEDRVDILYPPRHNYVFIGEKVVEKTK